MSVRVRADLAPVPDYQALPAPATAISAGGVAGIVSGVVNLADTELPPPPAAALAILDAARTREHDPSTSVNKVTARLALRFGIDPVQLAVGASGNATCLQLIQAVCEPGQDVVFTTPTGEDYPTLARIAHARPVPVPLRGDRHDLDAIRDVIDRNTTRVIILGNPHNPTGCLLRRDEFDDFLEHVPTTVLVVLDETHHHCVTERRAPDGLTLVSSGEWENVAALRTLATAPGLSDIGYCAAAPHVAAAVRKCGVPAAAATLGYAAAIATLDAGDQPGGSNATVAGERDRIRAELRHLGYPVPASHATFVWISLGADTARFGDHCAARGVRVRAYSGHGVRIRIGLTDENARFLEAARDFPRARPGRGGASPGQVNE